MPQQVMRDVTTDIVRRALQLARRHRRTVFISKTANGQGVDVATLDSRTQAGRDRLEDFLRAPARHYTISGLGAPEEPNAINWRRLNLATPRKILMLFQVGVSFFLKGTPFKIKWYRWMGCHIGRNVEIMQMAWLDHFRPELIFIGDNTLLGAFTRITCHAYEGSGKFRFGLVEIGANCVIGAGTGIGIIRIEDNVRTLPGTTVSPYLARIRAGSVVGYDPPSVKLPETATAAAAESAVQAHDQTGVIVAPVDRNDNRP